MCFRCHFILRINIVVGVTSCSSLSATTLYTLDYTNVVDKERMLHVMLNLLFPLHLDVWFSLWMFHFPHKLMNSWARKIMMKNELYSSHDDVLPQDDVRGKIMQRKQSAKIMLKLNLPQQREEQMEEMEEQDRERMTPQVIWGIEFLDQEYRAEILERRRRTWTTSTSTEWRRKKMIVDYFDSSSFSLTYLEANDRRQTARCLRQSHLDQKENPLSFQSRVLDGG